jgi:hypothetical protein
MGSASTIPSRLAPLDRSAMPCLIVSSFLSPMPLRPLSEPSSSALTSSSRFVIPLAFQNRLIVLGPSPGMSSSGRSPAGRLAARLS